MSHAKIYLLAGRARGAGRNSDSSAFGRRLGAWPGQARPCRVRIVIGCSPPQKGAGRDRNQSRQQARPVLRTLVAEDRGVVQRPRRHGGQAQGRVCLAFPPRHRRLLLCREGKPHDSAQGRRGPSGTGRTLCRAEGRRALSCGGRRGPPAPDRTGRNAQSYPSIPFSFRSAAYPAIGTLPLYLALIHPDLRSRRVRAGAGEGWRAG